MPATIFDPKFGAVPIFCIADTNQRNLIPFDQRREGCLAITFSPGQTWQLLPPPWSATDADWTPFCTGGYAAPAFTAFALSGEATAIEVGDTIAGTSRTFTWNTSNSGNVQTGSISITDTTASVVLASGLNNTGSDTVSFTDITHTTLASQVWTILGTDTHAGSFSRTFEVDWEYRMFAGTSTNAVLTGAQIQALAYNPIQPSVAGTWPLASGGFKFWASADTLGDIANFIDIANGFNVAMADVNQNPAYSHVAGSGYSYAIVSVTNGFGIVIPYRLWRSENLLGGSITVRTS
jgi:hypothetical protein